MSDFNEMPRYLMNRKSVLSHTGKYVPPDKVDGEQPYYYAQGIGSLTGQNLTNKDIVTHEGIWVTSENENVTHT